MSDLFDPVTKKPILPKTTTTAPTTTTPTTGIVAPPEAPLTAPVAPVAPAVAPEPTMDSLLGELDVGAEAPAEPTTGLDWTQRTVPAVGGMSVEDFFKNTPWVQNEQMRLVAMQQQAQTIQQQIAGDYQNKAASVRAEYKMDLYEEKKAREESVTMFETTLYMKGQQALKDLGAQYAEEYPGFDVNIDVATGDVQVTATSGEIDWSQIEPRILYDNEGAPVARYFVYEGQIFIDKDLRKMAEFQYGAEQGVRDMPTLQEWMEQQGKEFGDIQDSTAWTDLQDFYGQLNDPNTLNQWQTEGLDQAGTLLGMEEGGYQPAMQDLLGQLEQGIGGQEGLRAGEASDMDRKLQLDIQQLTQESTQIVEALAASGRSSAAFNSAIQARSQIANVQIQHSLAKAELDWARKDAEFAAKDSRYKVMVQTGQMTVDRYVGQKYQNAGLKMGAYAQEIAMISESNKDYLMQYQQDLGSMETHISMMYAAMMTDLDVDSKLMEQMQQSYEMYLAPIHTQMEQAMLQMQQEALDAATQQNIISNIISGLGVFANTVIGIGGLI